MTPEILLLPELLTRRAALDPARRAYVFLDPHGVEETTATYGDLHARALTVAAWLAERCAPGDRALLLFPTGPDFIVAFFGCLYARVIAVPLNPPGRGRLAGAARSIAADCEAAAVLTTGGLLAECREALPDAGTLHWLAVDQRWTCRAPPARHPRPPRTRSPSSSTPPVPPLIPRACWSRTRTCPRTRR